jgi:hypothetical protein
MLPDSEQIQDCEFQPLSRGSRNRAFLSEESYCVGPVGRAPLLGTLEDMLRKALDMGISLHGGLTGQPGGHLLAGTFEQKG